MLIYNRIGPKAFFLSEVARASTNLSYANKIRTKRQNVNEIS